MVHWASTNGTTVDLTHASPRITGLSDDCPSSSNGCLLPSCLRTKTRKSLSNEQTAALSKGIKALKTPGSLSEPISPAPIYGGYMIVNALTNVVVAGGNHYAFSMNIDDVEKFAYD